MKAANESLFIFWYVRIGEFLSAFGPKKVQNNTDICNGFSVQQQAVRQWDN
jgi:hypothetical protein